MQVTEDYLDDFFARKLGNLEVPPPEDGWVRIENELNRRSRAMKRYWLAAASFALILSATATMVYMNTNVNVVADQNIAVAVLENIPQVADSQQFATQSDQSVTQPVTQSNHQKPNNSIAAQYNDNSISQEQTIPQEDIVDLTENLQVAIQEDITVSAVTDDLLTIKSNIPVYMDSWNELLKAQPMKESFRKTIFEKMAQINLKAQERIEENALATATTMMPLYDEMAYVGVSSTMPKSQPRKRWAINGQFAPMYSYRAISSVPGGMRISDFDNAESPILAYSGGITLSRHVVNRLSVQIGIYYSQMGQAIKNLYPVSNMPIGMSSINQYNKNIFKTSSGSVTATSNLKSDTSYDTFFNSETPSINPVAAANNVSPSKYRLIEHLDYLEIPVTLRYKIIDNKLNIYVLGGMSTNILINNNIFIDNGNELLKGGSILMARPVNYSSALGFGLGYHINRNLSVEFEPVFKYFLQSYTTSSQIKSNPYAFGIFTGVVYRF